jgi:hypothetical protein
MNATAMSSFRMMSDAGYVIGPLLLGGVVDWSGPVSALVLAAGLTAALAAAFAAWAPETLRG